MRWEALFTDLEAQLAAAGQAGLEAEIADRQRGELAGLDLAARLRAQHGRILRVHLGLAGGPLTGTLSRLGADWLLLDSALGSHIAALDAVQLIEGMDRYADPSVPVMQLPLASALRGLARDRHPVDLHLRGRAAVLHGSIDRVGKDFLEFAVLEPGDPRRMDKVTSAPAVPFSRIAAVSSAR
ncbi:hypothetical protein ITX31_06080 [Arthrobacter gandavensis]|uniref:hypothetical protein n=1 Tax=Arthrobacter gandavensis TaxID=169960 RepID=UPI00188DDFFA|nr:hypothetical protein [Arthrobacter gandavensis]MBF4993675.1 hypothetical protein [Arthrobacter gandavensis]